jgi:hypothetical protein
MPAALNAVRTSAGVIGVWRSRTPVPSKKVVRDRGKDCRDRFLVGSVRAAIGQLEHDRRHLRVLFEP